MKNTEKRSLDICSDMHNYSGRSQLNAERVFFNSLVSVVLTLACLYVIGYFLKYVPNDIDMNKISATYYTVLGLFYPEAPERTGYIVTTLLFPVLFIFFYWLVNNVNFGRYVISSTRLVFPAILFFEILIFYFENAAQKYIIQKSFFYKFPILDILLFTILFAILWFLQQKHQNIRKIIEFVFLTVCVLSALYISLLYITGTPTLNSQTLFDFDVYYYPVFEVFNGKTLMVDFNNIYGFYPYLLVPILKLTGSISIQKFNIIVAALSLIALLSLLGVVWINIKNKIVALIGYLALIYFVILIPLSFGEFYYAYQPHRLIFPSIILLIGTLFVHAKSKVHKRMYISIGFFMVCLSLIWNIDTGVVVAIAWCLLLLYNVALDYSLSSWMMYKKALCIIAFTLLASAVSYGVIALITVVRTGTLISINQCFLTQSFFYSLGYNMLPMPESHPWVILAILYAIGLIVSLRNIKFLANDKTAFIRSRSSMYFFVSVMGAGVFSYYQGRSHDNVFLAVIWPGIVIAVMLLEDYYDIALECRGKCRTKKEKQINGPANQFEAKVNRVNRWTYFIKYVLLLFVLTSFMLAAPYTVLYNPNLIEMQHGSSSDFSKKVNDKVDLINKTVANDTSINLLIAEQDYYYTFLKTKNRTNLPSSVDWFKREDYDKAIHWIETNQEGVIMDSYMLSKLGDYSNQEIYQTIRSRYNIKDIGEEYYLLTVK